MSGKLLAFSSPHGTREQADAYSVSIPADYVDHFQAHNVTDIVRLNQVLPACLARVCFSQSVFARVPRCPCTMWKRSAGKYTLVLSRDQLSVLKMPSVCPNRPFGKERF